MFFTTWTWLKARLGADEGATMVEYGLMVALIAIVVSAGAYFLGTQVLGLFNSTGNCVTNGGPC